MVRLGDKQIGSGVGLGDAVLRIFPTGLQIRLAVDEATLLTMRRGMSVQVRVPAISDELQFYGKIARNRRSWL